MISKTDRRKIGGTIKKLRKEKNISAEQVAKEISTSTNYVYQVESGRTGFSLDTILKFSKALKVHPAQLFEYFESDDKNIVDNKQPEAPDFEVSELHEPDVVKINDKEVPYGRTGPTIQRVCDLLSEHPESQQHVLKYLSSYHEGGKGRLSKLGGIVDALDPESIETLIIMLVRKLRESSK